jgi:hypothetical protein
VLCYVGLFGAFGMCYGAMKLQQESNGQIALWYLISAMVGIVLGGFDTFVFSIIGTIYLDRCDVSII